MAHQQRTKASPEVPIHYIIIFIANYIFILYLTHGFSGLGNSNCKTGRETFKFWHLVPLILEVRRYVVLHAWKWNVTKSHLGSSRYQDNINSPAPRRCGRISKYKISKHFVVSGIYNSSCEIAISLFHMGFTDDKSTLVQEMACCR